MTQAAAVVAYERHLGSLVGSDFEREVCARMQGLVSDYQRVPAKPQGDGGVDGLSHGQKTAYCCYGPEQVPAKVKQTDGLKKDIVMKFSQDLLRLFELETYGRGRLRQKANPELETILGDGRRIEQIRLVVSWFETHRVIGPLNSKFQRYQVASEGRFVNPEASLTIWGPQDLAASGAVDEHTVFRMEHRALLKRVQNADPDTLPPDTVADFEAKFDNLRDRLPVGRSRIDGLAQHFRETWAEAVALDHELASTSVMLHESFEIARKHAATSAILKSMGSGQPHELITAMREEVSAHLKVEMEPRLGALTSRIADGVVGGLIGECPLDWRGGSHE